MRYLEEFKEKLISFEVYWVFQKNLYDFLV